jgi:hypothetical protein
MAGMTDVFERDEAIERNALRQGDVISNIHLLGALNFVAFQYSKTTAAPDWAAWSVPTAPVFGDAIILSHDCEIALDNKIKVTSIVLAPLRDLHKATETTRVQELIDSNDVRTEGVGASFLKYFYIEPNTALQFADGAVADFAKCFSVRKNCFEILLAQKVAQLTRDAAAAMALKLALYFARSQATAA